LFGELPRIVRVPYAFTLPMIRLAFAERPVL